MSWKKSGRATRVEVAHKLDQPCDLRLVLDETHASGIVVHACAAAGDASLTGNARSALRGAWTHRVAGAESCPP